MDPDASLALAIRANGNAVLVAVRWDRWTPPGGSRRTALISGMPTPRWALGAGGLIKQTTDGGLRSKLAFAHDQLEDRRGSFVTWREKGGETQQRP